MKILIVSFSDIQGGAAKAAHRLNTLLINNGIDAKMLVIKKISNDDNVISPKNKIKKIFTKLASILNPLPTFFYKINGVYSASFFPSHSIVKEINEINPDIVHLHWINAGMLNINRISKIKAPIVWTLHDMWAFTGGCHYSDGCLKFKQNCGKCPVLTSTKENDISRLQFLKKEKQYNKKNSITIVALSNWLQKQAKQSPLLKNKRVINLPNPINTNFFKPINIEVSRKKLGLEVDKKYILFGAMTNASMHRKGFLQLKDALQHLKKDSDVELLIFGSEKPNKPMQLEFKEHYLGHISDFENLRQVYNSADVAVVPSLEENLSNIIMESLSCGTPVVAFDIGGNKDMIDHKENGYLANELDTKDLSKGIDWIIYNEEIKKIRAAARKKIVTTFDNNIVVSRYIDLYESIL